MAIGLITHTKEHSTFLYTNDNHHSYLHVSVALLLLIVCSIRLDLMHISLEEFYAAWVRYVIA
jgi:hypothetical protein